MTYSSQFFSNYLEETRITFDNLQHYPDITGAISGNGYPEARLNVGKDFHAAFHSLSHQYLDRRQSARTKGKEMVKKFLEISVRYRSHVNRLKKEFILDHEVLTQLGLTLPMDRRRAGFIVQVTGFYNKALTNPNIFAKLQVLGFTEENLEQDRRCVEEYQALRSEREKIWGECQELISKRDKAYRDLKVWVDAFIATCKFVFADNLQVLEKIGILILNRPRRTKKQEPAGDSAQL